ncbi:MEDS domain-containing protein [Pseudalkalibacillus sp. SCS-8]|uniref:MEDS domain-containing protein n=1 Tax=Pseudalkalibacillus nanhaiensis TaxID=3115291 RepID=UPI0032DAA4E9
MTRKMSQLFEEKRTVHVLYEYENMQNYIEQVVRFIEEGISVGDFVILIENDPVYHMIKKELDNRLTNDQLEYVHRVNNFDFYFSSGSYHPPAIVQYFNKVVQPYVDKELPFRSWAHVEWSSLEGPLHIIEDFERIVDKAVHQYSFPLICAYEKKLMPNHLKTLLMETHPYVLSEDEFIESQQYRPKKHA